MRRYFKSLIPSFTAILAVASLPLVSEAASSSRTLRTGADVSTFSEDISINGTPVKVSTIYENDLVDTYAYNIRNYLYKKDNYIYAITQENVINAATNLVISKFDANSGEFISESLFSYPEELKYVNNNGSRYSSLLFIDENNNLIFARLYCEFGYNGNIELKFYKFNPEALSVEEIPNATFSGQGNLWNYNRQSHPILVKGSLDNNDLQVGFLFFSRDDTNTILRMIKFDEANSDNQIVVSNFDIKAPVYDPLDYTTVKFKNWLNYCMNCREAMEVSELPDNKIKYAFSNLGYAVMALNENNVYTVESLVPETNGFADYSFSLMNNKIRVGNNKYSKSDGVDFTLFTEARSEDNTLTRTKILSFPNKPFKYPPDELSIDISYVHHYFITEPWTPPIVETPQLRAEEQSFDKGVYLYAYAPGSGLAKYLIKYNDFNTAIENVSDSGKIISLNGRTVSLSRGEADLSVYDISGRLAFKSKSCAQADLSSLPAGCYIIKWGDTASRIALSDF